MNSAVAMLRTSRSASSKCASANANSFFDAEQELSKLLGKKVDLVSKTALSERLRNEILAEARCIYAA
jgi:predicted nucleotidyltransferase